VKSKHLDADWLRKKYVVEGLSTYDIGKLVGRDPKRIHDKLRDFGIPTRPRGMNLKGEDNYMSRPGVKNPFAGKKHSKATREVLRKKASVPKPYLRGRGNGMSGRCGPLNPRFVDGSSPERQRTYASGVWKEMLRRIYKRDGHACLRCGSRGTGARGLHAHHVKPWAGNEALRFDENNIVTLCRKCHEWVHSRKNKKNEYIG